ncbi:MAG: hypothetical protein GY915_04285, partial [bacterium]|nr:hypothetical protein [bacterium]
CIPLPKATTGLKRISNVWNSNDQLETQKSLFSSLGGSEKTQEKLANRLIGDGSLALKSLGAGTSNLHEWVKQSMMLNAYRESLDDWREGAGLNRFWPGLVSMSATRGLYQQSFGWLTAGEMAAWMLPVIQTFMFVFIVAMIFLVFPLALLPGGVGYLSVWAKGLIWVNTWPIFYAIINSFGEMILASTLGAHGEGYGLSKLTQEDFSDTVIHSYAVVQFFCSMVPVLSWMLLSKSGYAFTQMVDRLAPSGVGSAIGSAAVDGNLNLDNVSTGNRTIAQQSVGGSLSRDTSVYDSGIRQQIGSDGGSTYVSDVSHGATEVSVTEGQQNAITKQSAEERGFQKSESVALEASQGATNQSALDVAKHFGSSTTVGNRFLNEDKVGVDESMKLAEQISKDWSQSEGRTDMDRSARDLHAKGNIGGMLSKLVGVDVGGGFSNTLSTEDQKAYNFAQKNGWSKDHAENYSNALSAVRSGDVSFSTDEGTKAAESYNSNFAETQRHSDNLNASKSRSEKYSELSSGTTSEGGSVTQNLNDAVLESIADRDHGGSKSAAAQWSKSNQGAFAQEGRQYIDGKMEQISHIGGGIDGKYDAAKREISSQAPTGVDARVVHQNAAKFGVGEDAKTVHQNEVSQRKRKVENVVGEPRGMLEGIDDKIYGVKKEIEAATSGAREKVGGAQEQSHITRGFVAPGTTENSSVSGAKSETPIEKSHRLRNEEKAEKVSHVGGGDGKYDAAKFGVGEEVKTAQRNEVSQRQEKVVAARSPVTRGFVAPGRTENSGDYGPRSETPIQKAHGLRNERS